MQVHTFNYSMLPLKLFVSFYTPSDPLRRKEFYDCLVNNAKSGIFNEIILLIDDGISPLGITDQDFGQTSISIVHMPSRPYYSDWINLTSIDRDYDFISVCTNSDIDFSNVTKKDFNKSISEGTFICLSRHEIDKSTASLLPHPNPHWTQDTWAIMSSDTSEISKEHLKDLSIPLGIPRCDGKVAFVFHSRGWNLKNPFEDILTIHRHSSDFRKYDRRSVELMGMVSWVYPCSILDVRSKVVHKLFTRNHQQALEDSQSVIKWEPSDHSK